MHSRQMKRSLGILFLFCLSAYAQDYLRFYPAKDAPAAMKGGVFEGTDGNPSSGPYSLIHKVKTIPGVKWHRVNVSLGQYRYLRYRGPANSYGSVAEVEFYRNGVKVVGTFFGTEGSYYPDTGIDKAFDSRPNTRWIAPIPTGAYVGIDTRPQGPATNFGETVGLNVKYVQGEPWDQDAKQMLIELGVRWVRDVVEWYGMEQEPGVYSDFPDEFKERLAFYKQNNIGVVFGLWYHNSNAYPDDPLNAEAYGNYAAYVATLLKASGVKFVLEVWNEPRTFFIQPMLGGDWVGRPPSPWLDHYVEMATKVVNKVKAIDPTIKVLVNDDLYVTHYWYLEKGLPQALDGFAIHPYSTHPEHAAVSFDTDWCWPWQVVDIDNTIGSGVRRLKEQGQLKLGKSMEVWSTEQGWWQGDAESEEQAAMFLPRAFITSADSGVAVTCWFSSQDVTDGPMGLKDYWGNPRKSYTAFKVMNEQLGGYALIKHTQATGDSYGLQSYVFQGPSGDTKVVVWVVEEGQQAVYRIYDVEGVTAVDHLGNHVDVFSEMIVGNGPIYLSGIKPTSFFP
jgi:hypothetical protein